MNILNDLNLSIKLHRDGRKIVVATGCFDALHLGHMQFLERAKALGDVLWVGVPDDAAVAALKGNDRPLYSAKERVEMLSFLTCVDYTTIYSSPTPTEWLDVIQPHIYVKGEEYATKDLPERAVVEGYGGEVILLPQQHEHSTTGVVDRVIKNYICPGCSVGGEK